MLYCVTCLLLASFDFAIPSFLASLSTTSGSLRFKSNMRCCFWEREALTKLETLIFTNGEGGTLSITDILTTSHLGAYTGESTIKVDDPLLLSHGTAVAKNITGSVTAAELARKDA